MVNVTLCFSANQALLAAKAGATFISPFVGRLDDTGHDGMELMREIRTIYDNYPDLRTQILAASIRNVLHVKQAAMIGADVATVPPARAARAGAPPADRQGPGAVPRRLEEDRPADRLSRRRAVTRPARRAGLRLTTRSNASAAHLMR